MIWNVGLTVRYTSKLCLHVFMQPKTVIEDYILMQRQYYSSKLYHTHETPLTFTNACYINND